MTDIFSIKLSGLIQKSSLILVLWLLFVRMSPLGGYLASVAIPHKPLIATVLLVVSGIFGWLCVTSIKDREENSWKEPKSKASALFLGYIIFATLGVLFSG